VPPVTRIHTRSHYPYGGAPGERIGAIKGFGSPGETVSLSFCLEADADVPAVVVEASIPGVAVDVHVVHAWDQAGVGVYRGPRVRVPELLLKDDRASLDDGYTRRCGSPLHVHRRRVRYSPPPLRLEGAVRTDLEAGVPKQLWLTVRIPADLRPGTYTGEVKPGGVAVEVEVLPLALAEPEQDLMLWYLGTLDCRRHQHYVRPAVFEAQLRDIYATGFRSVSLFETDPVKLQRAVDTAQRVGFRRAVVLGGPDERA
jgi:hypothetical protein